MKRLIIAGALTVILLTSCATARRPQALAFTIDQVDASGSITLSLDQDALVGGGYRLGDWVSLEIGGVMVDAVVAEGPHQVYPTVVAYEGGVRLYLPRAIAAGSGGVLRPSPSRGRQPNTAVSLSGSFVFTF